MTTVFEPSPKRGKNWKEFPDVTEKDFFWKNENKADDAGHIIVAVADDSAKKEIVSNSKETEILKVLEDPDCHPEPMAKVLTDESVSEQTKNQQ